MCWLCVCTHLPICFTQHANKWAQQNHEALSSPSGSLSFLPTPPFSHLSAFVCAYLHSVCTFVTTPHYKNVTQDNCDGTVLMCKSSSNDFGKEHKSFHRQATGSLEPRTDLKIIKTCAQRRSGSDAYHITVMFLVRFCQETIVAFHPPLSLSHPAFPVWISTITIK